MLSLPLLDSAQGERPLLWSQGQAVTVAEFLDSVAGLAERLPTHRYSLNLCEQRQDFLIAFCAALLRGQANLLPTSRAPAVVEEMLATHADAYICDDARVAQPDANPVATAVGDPRLPADQVAVVAFTSGSTGAPQRHIKRWSSFAGSNACNVARIRACLAPQYAGARPWIVATVPSQHMYGIETSVLLPLLGDMAVHGARPLFPADIAAALAEVPPPRILVTTPVHLRALSDGAQRMPGLALVVSATAPLDQELARTIEQKWSTRLLEMFGSTETCVIATRETARENTWHLYPRIQLEPLEDGTTVSAPWFERSVTLQDMIELLPERRFSVRGRHADMVEVAGKRASLADLTRRLQSLPGVSDAVVFQPDPPGARAVRRVAALAVAPGLDAATLCAQLARSIDAAFIPRPLRLVQALPRNELGKLPREQLLAALRAAAPASRK